ncbi:MAG: hypothetical protein KDD35_11585, partial [Bdellovibrionales bacterium]|nr:hypothetical protein [Bdellovibrionales bacterium]
MKENLNKNIKPYFVRLGILMLTLLLVAFVGKGAPAQTHGKGGKVTVGKASTTATKSNGKAGKQLKDIQDLQFVEGDEEGNEMRALKTELLVTA